MPDLAELDAENQEAYEDLLVTIEASEGVLSLLIAVCDNSQFRDEIIARLKTELEPDIRCYRLSLIREEPSLKMTILQAMQTDEYLREGGRSVVMVTGADQLFFLQLGEEKSEQDVFFWLFAVDAGGVAGVSVSHCAVGNDATADADGAKSTGFLGLAQGGCFALSRTKLHQ